MTGDYMLLTGYFFVGEFHYLYPIFQKYPHHRESFNRGMYLSEPGTSFSKVYYIMDGLVQLSVLHDSGEEKIFGFWGHDSIYPIICKEQKFSLEYSILLKALTDVKVLAFSVETFNQILAENSNITHEVVDHYCRYSNLLLFSATTQSYENIATRLCNLFYLYLYYAPNRENCVDLSQQEIASLIGTSRVCVSRELSLLKQEELIRTSRGKVYILNREEVEKRSSEYCRL